MLGVVCACHYGVVGMCSETRRSIAKHLARWNVHFDGTIDEQLFAGITGKPWSLYGYVIQWEKITHVEHDFEGFAHMFANLHAIHHRGPDSFDKLGAAIRQGFKALEQRSHRDRYDWTLAWLWTNLPDPRPPRRFARGLAHPSEHSAGVAYIREMQTLQSHHEKVLDDEWHRGRKSEGKWKGKDQVKGDDHGLKGAPDNKAKEQEHGGGGRGRSGGGRGGAGGRGGGAGDAPSAQ